MRIAVVTDSNSGITQEQGNEQEIHILPMPFMIDGSTYYEGINLTQEEFYSRLEQGADISTSQPSPESVMKLWEKLLADFDQVVHIPMSSALSSSYQTAVMLAKEYNGKVEVVNNQRVSVTQRQSALEAKVLADQGIAAAEIKKVLEDCKFDSSIYIMVDTLKYLKKGGRITPAAAALGTLLKLKPVLSIYGEKLDAYAKARTVKQAKALMISAILHDLEEKYGDREGACADIQIAHSNSEKAADEFRQELLAVFQDRTIYVDSLALSIACHTGPGGLAVAFTKKPGV